MINNKVTIKNARILFPNFAGREGQFNPAGRRNFCILLDNDFADKLQKDGWNIRWLQPRSEDEEQQAYLQIGVSFETPPNIPPMTIEMITSRGRTELTEDSIMVLDWADIANVDLKFRPYNWKLPSGKSGVKAYLETMYVTIAEDELAKKYQDVPEDNVANVGESLCSECSNIEECRMKGHCAGLGYDN